MTNRANASLLMGNPKTKEEFKSVVWIYDDIEYLKATLIATQKAFMQFNITKENMNDSGRMPYLKQLAREYPTMKILIGMMIDMADDTMSKTDELIGAMYEEYRR